MNSGWREALHENAGMAKVWDEDGWHIVDWERGTLLIYTHSTLYLYCTVLCYTVQICEGCIWGLAYRRLDQQ